MIYCRELDKEYSDKESIFKALKENEKKICLIKSSREYKSIDKGQYAYSNLLLKNDSEIKSIPFIKEGFVYPVINTTRYMDSHSDVHFDGIWKKSVSEQNGKIFYVSNHLISIDNVIAWPENVKLMTMLVDWSLVGKNYAGQTEALIFEIAEKNIKKQNVIDAINERRSLTGSVRMGYVKIRMAINSDNPDYKENKVYFDEKINLIVNNELAYDLGYFFGVEEAKIIKEGSLELNPSNDATNIIYNTEPPMALNKPEPLKKALDFNYLINNI